jgi:hypothetical protein
VVATETFDAADGDFATGFSGTGSFGWAAGWTDNGTNVTTRIDTDSLRVRGGNSDNLATRQLAAPLTSDIFFSFTFEIFNEVGNSAGDTIEFWLNSANAYGAAAPAIGFEASGDAGGDIQVRLIGGDSEFASLDLGEADDPIGIVGLLSKSTNTVYDTFDLWVVTSLTGFPDLENLGAPDATADILLGTLAAVQWVGIRGSALEGNDAFFIDDLTIATVDVAPVPEPTTMALTGMGCLAGLALVWRKRRLAKA